MKHSVNHSDIILKIELGVKANIKVSYSELLGGEGGNFLMSVI